jgi:hypothetical protein
MSGVKTNLSLLAAIFADSSFQGEGLIDRLWLEKNATRLIESGNQISTTDINHKTQLSHISESSSDPATRTAASMASTMLRKGDAWSINLQKLDPQGRQCSEKHYFHLDRLLRMEAERTWRSGFGWLS